VISKSAKIHPRNGYATPAIATAKTAITIAILGLLKAITFAKSDLALSGFICSST